MSPQPTEAWACDTSVAIAALDPNHRSHAPCRRWLIDQRPALSGHAAFETYSVLTRLPPPLRLTAHQAASTLGKAFPVTCWPHPDQLDDLRTRFGDLGIIGGSVYDALVGQAALDNGLVLLTGDRRAERTYRLLGVRFQPVEPQPGTGAGESGEESR